jgi:hypothetical protein
MYVRIRIRFWYTFWIERKEGLRRLVWYRFCYVYMMDLILPTFCRKE